MRLVAAIFVAVAMVLVAPTGSEAKTALFGAQGLFDATCPQIANEYGMDCPLASEERMTGPECYTSCPFEESLACYHMDERLCFCCQRLYKI